MKRRSFCAVLGGVAAGGLAGCIRDGTAPADLDESETDSATDTGSPTDQSGTSTGVDETPTKTPTENGETPTVCGDGGGEETPGTPSGFVEATLERTGRETGGEVDRATVCFASAANEVVVTGTIWGSDGCKRAALGDATYDAESDELTVTVTTANRETEETMACTQAIVELDYRVTGSFDGGLPGSVRVLHDHGQENEAVTTKAGS